jgi:predicted Zn-dependent protease with MMP-like domain
MNAIAQRDDVAKKNLELVGTYIPSYQKKLLEEWANEDRRSVSNLVAGILLDALTAHFGAAKMEQAKNLANTKGEK